jgi:hypothetical protein
MPVLHVLSLEEDELALAYPLVRSAVQVDPRQWQEFARELIGRGGGVLGVRTDTGCFYGLATFCPLAMLRHPLVLSVELLVAIDLGGRERVHQALLARLDEIAQALGCSNIVLTTSANARGRWEIRGFEAETAILMRKLVERDGPQFGATMSRRTRSA